MKRLRKKFELLKKRIEGPGQRNLDPVSLVWAFRSAADREIAGFLISCFAYGRRETIISNSRILLGRLGPNPAKTIRKTTAEVFQQLFKGFVHRLNTAGDAALLCAGLGLVLRRHGSLRNLFAECVRDAGETGWIGALRSFVGTIRSALEEKSQRTGFPAGRTSHLLPMPGPGAAKRLNLFLKWMIRKDTIDPGVWSVRLGHLRSRLVMPVDTHIAAMAKEKGIVRRATPDWIFALEVTAYLKAICPEDPLRYDFCLCHEGMERYRRRKR